MTRTRARCLGIAAGMMSMCAAVAAEEHATPKLDTCALTSRSLVEKASALRHNSHVPALAAAVVLGGTVVAKGTVGVRAEGGAPAVDSDAWHIGSITKPLTATLTARLVERDLLRFSSTLHELGSDLLSSDDRSYATVTVRDLLSHHSGLGTSAEDQGMRMFRDDVRSLPEQRRSLAKLLLSQPPLAAPGAKLEYANGNYLVMAALLERVGKDSWENLIAREVLAPLGLKSAGFGAPADGDQAKAPIGHELTGGSVRPLRPENRDPIPAVMGPAGGIHMTMEDLAMFGYRHAAGEFAADGYLSAETYRLLHTARGEDAALGWFKQEWHGHRMLSHTGSNGYWYAMLIIQPEKRLAIAVAANLAPEAGADVAVGELVSALVRTTILGECLISPQLGDSVRKQPLHLAGALPVNTAN
jgi:CubicO group peptidase (beta-lactamase class C family)